MGLIRSTSLTRPPVKIDPSTTFLRGRSRSDIEGSKRSGQMPFIRTPRALSKPPIVSSAAGSKPAPSRWKLWLQRQPFSGSTNVRSWTHLGHLRTTSGLSYERLLTLPRDDDSEG